MYLDTNRIAGNLALETSHLTGSDPQQLRDPQAVVLNLIDQCLDYLDWPVAWRKVEASRTKLSLYRSRTGRVESFDSMIKEIADHFSLPPSLCQSVLVDISALNLVHVKSKEEFYRRFNLNSENTYDLLNAVIDFDLSAQQDRGQELELVYTFFSRLAELQLQNRDLRLISENFADDKKPFDYMNHIYGKDIDLQEYFRRQLINISEKLKIFRKHSELDLAIGLPIESPTASVTLHICPGEYESKMGLECRMRLNSSHAWGVCFIAGVNFTTADSNLCMEITRLQAIANPSDRHKIKPAMHQITKGFGASPNDLLVYLLSVASDEVGYDNIRFFLCERSGWLRFHQNIIDPIEKTKARIERYGLQSSSDGSIFLDQNADEPEVFKRTPNTTKSKLKEAAFHFFSPNSL